MISNSKLFSVGDFDFRLQHLLIIGILAISVSTSMLIRAQPAADGFALFEFDPFFNYRATQYIIDNGYNEYLQWNDEMGWYPHGRDVSSTSQSGLHLITAILYQTFGGNSSLLDFTIILPIVIGSLTCVIVFALVRVIGGTTAGLIASLMFAISIPIILRGVLGWFKSEPLGIFFGLLSIYLLLSGIKNNKGKISFTKLVFAGIFLSIGFASWGGVQFFLLPLAIFVISLPFFLKKNNFLLWAIPTFQVSLSLTGTIFDRPGPDFILGYGGVLIFLPTAFMALIIIVQKFSSIRTKIRNSVIVLGIFVASGIGILSAGSIGLPSFRYMHALNPFLATEDFLVTSISEHTATTLEHSFFLLSSFIVFGIVGLWLIFSTRTSDHITPISNHMKAFAVIFGLIAIYASSAFVRLEVYGAIGLIILGSVGFTILLQNVLQKPNTTIKFIFCGVVIALFLIPMVYPENTNWVSAAQQSATVYTGATLISEPQMDWIEAMLWMQDNTPTDSVIFAWWDWGYWIQTLGERTTLADNSTLITWQIEKIARTFLSPVEDSWVILNSDVETLVPQHYVAIPGLYETKPFYEGTVPHPDGWDYPEIGGLKSDYVLITIAGTRLNTMLESGEPITVYSLDGGGDESKLFWFHKISGIPVKHYLYPDATTPTKFATQNTLIAALIPFSIGTYYNVDTNEYSNDWKDGFMPFYIKDPKLTDPDGPFPLVYASPSFYDDFDGGFLTVLIYKVNHDYNP